MEKKIMRNKLEMKIESCKLWIICYE